MSGTTGDDVERNQASAEGASADGAADPRQRLANQQQYLATSSSSVPPDKDEGIGTALDNLITAFHLYSQRRYRPELRAALYTAIEDWHRREMGKCADCGRTERVRPAQCFYCSPAGDE